MTTPPRMSTAQVASLLTEHMAVHGLAEPVSVNLTVKTFGHQEVSVQLDGAGLVDTARALLAWVATMASVALSAWRPQSGTTVHLHARATITGPAGVVNLTVYGAVPFDTTMFDDLTPGRTRPVSLGQLTRWAAGASEAAA